MGIPTYDTDYTARCRKKNNAEYMRQYRKQNPEKAKQHRITSEIRHLESLGYIVKAPRKKPEQMTVEELETIVNTKQKKLREYKRKWRAKNREHIRDYQRQYFKDHPEKFPSAEERRKYLQKWRDEHREEVREYRRQWYRKNADKAKEYQRKWAAKNPDYTKRYRQALAQAKQKQAALKTAENGKVVSNNDRQKTD